MLSEVFIDLCFIRQPEDNFKQQIEKELTMLFPETIHWYLEAKMESDFEMVVAELRGMGRWQHEAEILEHLEALGSECFWNWLKGMQMNVYPVRKGGSSCG